MKTFKVDFSHGLNLMTDKRMLPEGYVVLADNIDLRSGAIRPFKMPEPYTTISGGIPVGTTCIWEFKNSWFFSSYYRQYVGEYTSTQTRVYFCETGIGASYGASPLIPQKIVNGVQAQLGTIVPGLAPTVAPTLADTPAAFTATAGTTGGALATGQYSYRISAILNNNILPPTQAVLVNIPQVNGSNITTGEVALTWKAVPQASGYIIFGRILGQEQTLFTLGSGATSVYDLGNVAPTGAYAANYQPLTPLTYVYTYVRSVGGMQDESGPSPASNTVNSSYTRIITRNPNTDGFYNNAIAYSATTAASSTIGALNVLGYAFSGENLVLLTTAISAFTPWWVSGMKLVFSIDPTYTPYSFSLPAPLAAPTGVTLTNVSGGTVPAGGYTYYVCAVRGPIANIYLYPSNLPAMTNGATNTISLGSPGSVKVTWKGVSGASGYAVWRTNGANYSMVGLIDSKTTTFTDTGSIIATSVTPPTTNTTGATYNAVNTSIPASWENPSVTIPGSIIILQGPGPTNVNVQNYPDEAIWLAASPISGFSPTFAGFDQDVFNITSATNNVLLGTATYFQDSRSIFTTPNFINVFTPTSSNTINVLYDVPYNNYIKYWNIYRAGDSGSTFEFVSQQPIGVTTYIDTISTTNLGAALPTEYTDTSTGGAIVFQPPPIDLICPQLYNGMLFGISGNALRWGPTGFPDAWPAAYSKSFSFPPQCLIVYAGGIFVFCENGIWRGDGNLPGTMSFTQLQADGCIAPFSPKLIGEHIIYAAKRGLMLIRGMEAICLTERFIPYRLMTEPSSFMGGVTAQNFWWFTTDHTSAYGALLDAGMNPIPAVDTFGWVTAKDKPTTGLIYEARSFVWQNKYYLYFVNLPTSEFAGNPCWCVDLGIVQLAFTLPNYPITTLGFKPQDVHVSSTGECFALLTIDATYDPSNRTKFIAAESDFNQTFSPTVVSTSQVLYRFNPSFGQNVPMRFRTGEVTANAPYMRKRWREVRLNGSGSCQLRVFIDGALLPLATGLTYVNLVLTESPIHPTRVMLPIGSWGYSVSVEICGDGVVRLIEFGFDPMPGEAQKGDEQE